MPEIYDSPQEYPEPDDASGYIELPDYDAEDDMHLIGYADAEDLAGDHMEEAYDGEPADTPAEPLGPEQIIARPPLRDDSYFAAQKREKFMPWVRHLHDESDINVPRVRHFAAALDLQPAGEFVILPSPNVDYYKDGLAASGVQSLDGGVSGYYTSGAELSVLFRRSSAWTVEASSTQVETNLAHEYIGHASGIGADDVGAKQLLDYRVRSAVSVPRNGFCNYKTGDMLEEGFSRWIDNAYAHAADIQTPAPDYPATGRYASPHVYDNGAMAWDVLFAADKDLLDVALAARGDLAARAEMRDRINAVQSGLFGKLMRVQLSPKGDYAETVRNFGRGLEFVLRATGIARDELSDVCVNGPGARAFDRKLHDYEQRTGFTFSTGPYVNPNVKP